MNDIFYKIGLLAILAAVSSSLAVGVLNSASAQDNPLAKLGEMLSGNATGENMTGGNATMSGNMTGNDTGRNVTGGVGG